MFMKKMYLMMVFAITTLGLTTKAQNTCPNCENIAANAMYNFDNLSYSSSFVDAVKKRVNCYNPKTLCSKTVINTWDYIINTHNQTGSCGNYTAYPPFTNACVASMALNTNNTASSVNNFAQALRDAVQRDVDVIFGLGVRKIQCIIITDARNSMCGNGYDLVLKVKFCTDKNDNTHQ